MRVQDDAAIGTGGGQGAGEGSPAAAAREVGGYKQSGIGREMGVAGLEEFLESKTLATVVS